MKEENTYNEHTGTNLPDYLRVNPFSVPKGYFEDLEKTTTAKIAEQKLKTHFSGTNFTVPEGYFEGLNDRVQSRLFEETLRDQVADTGFSVPQGYFENNQTDISTCIAELKLKDRLSREGYSVPKGYFEELSQHIRSAIYIEQSVSPHKESFTIPPNYFETLSSHIMDKVAQQATTPESDLTDTPVVRMPAKRKWHEYAAAAAVVFIISFGAYWTLGTNRQTSSEANNTQIALHEISNEEIFGYLTQETEGVELIELASLLSEENIDRPFDINERVEDQEIEEYLNYML